MRPRFQYWPRSAPARMPITDIVKMYSAGFAGCEFSPNKIRAAAEKFTSYIDGQGRWAHASGDGAAHAYAIAGSGAGKLSLTFPAIGDLYAGALPGPAQQRGDCVSHGQKTANLATLCNEVLHGQPDEVTGTLEAAPEITAAGIRNGALSTEAIYWYRGHGGDGWHCSESATVSTTKAGCVVRRDFPEIGIDLTEYSGGLAGKYGRTEPPEVLGEVLNDHLIRTATRLDSLEQIADFCQNGYGINSCGGEGFSRTRDANGVSRRSGSWAHSMAYIGADLRPWVQQEYGVPGLVLVQNSWGKFNSGPRRIYGTGLDIPDGSFWAKWTDISRRSSFAMSSVNGWKAKKLPNFIPKGIV